MFEPETDAEGDVVLPRPKTEHVLGVHQIGA